MRSGKSFYYILSIYLILCYGSVFAQSDWAIISLVVNGIPKGDIECQLEGNEITLPTKQVLNIIRPYLSSHYFAIIGEIKTDYLTLENLSFLGLPTQFDAASLTVHIQIPPQFMTEKSLGSEEKPQLKMTQILKPAQVSAFLNGNVVFGIKKNSELPPYMIGSLNIDGALNIYGWVSEAETAFILDQSVKTELRNLRLIHDFRNIGVRLSVGTVDLPQTGFQSRFNVAGIAIGSNQESLLLPDQSSITERRKPSILKDSDFIVVNNTAKILVSVNGITIRNTTVGPGRYRIGDLPLASGLNNVVIKIEEEGKPPIEQHIGIPYEEALLSQQDFRFAFGMGMTTDDMIAPIGSAFFRYGITDTLEAGVNIQGGFGVLLGGISLKLATFLGYFYGDGAIKVSYNDGGLIYTPAYNSSLQYRLNLPYQPYIPRFGLSFQYMSSGFSPPQIINTTTSLIPSWKVAAQIAQATPVGISLALLGDYSSNSGNAGSFSTAIGLSMPFGKETTFSASFAIDNRLGYWLPQASLSLLVIPGTGKTTSHVYQSLINGETGIEVAWNSGNKTRDYNGSVSVTNPVEAGTSPRSINANLKRTGALIDWGTQFWYRDNRDGTEPGYGGTFSTEGSIVYADGIPAFSHRVFDSFAI
ncbi:MAG: hypothetical protein LDL24_06855, partial [Treponema sp.]|nr:hypothetical protein [Treponema sp.]